MSPRLPILGGRSCCRMDVPTPAEPRFLFPSVQQHPINRHSTNRMSPILLQVFMRRRSASAKVNNGNHLFRRGTRGAPTCTAAGNTSYPAFGKESPTRLLACTAKYASPHEKKKTNTPKMHSNQASGPPWSSLSLTYYFENSLLECVTVLVVL